MKDKERNMGLCADVFIHPLAFILYHSFMSTTERILTDDRGGDPGVLRYPSRRAVVLPGLHVINELLKMPARRWWSLPSFGVGPGGGPGHAFVLRVFQQDRPQGRTRIWACRSISCAARRESLLIIYARSSIRPGDNARRPRKRRICRMPGGLRFAPALAGDELLKNMTKEKIDGWLPRCRKHRSGWWMDSD